MGWGGIAWVGIAKRQEDGHSVVAKGWVVLDEMGWYGMGRGGVTGTKCASPPSRPASFPASFPVCWRVGKALGEILSGVLPVHLNGKQ